MEDLKKYEIYLSVGYKNFEFITKLIGVFLGLGIFLFVEYVEYETLKIKYDLIIEDYILIIILSSLTSLLCVFVSIKHKKLIQKIKTSPFITFNNDKMFLTDWSVEFKNTEFKKIEKEGNLIKLQAKNPKRYFEKFPNASHALAITSFVGMQDKDMAYFTIDASEIENDKQEVTAFVKDWLNNY